MTKRTNNIKKRPVPPLRHRNPSRQITVPVRTFNKVVSIFIPINTIQSNEHAKNFLKQYNVILDS